MFRLLLIFPLLISELLLIFCSLLLELPLSEFGLEFVSGSNPDLKASAEFTKLMEELTNTENKIAYSRQLYNSSVASYNMKLQTFPSNLVASMTSFKAATYLQVPEEETKTPDVSFKKYEDL